MFSVLPVCGLSIEKEEKNNLEEDESQYHGEADSKQLEALYLSLGWGLLASPNKTISHFKTWDLINCDNLYLLAVISHVYEM